MRKFFGACKKIAKGVGFVLNNMAGGIAFAVGTALANVALRRWAEA